MLSRASNRHHINHGRLAKVDLKQLDYVRTRPLDISFKNNGQSESCGHLLSLSLFTVVDSSARVHCS